MIQTSLNIFDLGVIIIVGLSALLSFYRGFLREIMSLGAWIGAAFITLYTFPDVSEMIKPQVKNDMVASGLASMGVFMISLVVISILSGLLVKYLKPSGEVGFLDNLIGLMFGVARGVLLVAIGFFMMTLVMNEKEYPDWVTESKTRPYVAQASDMVAKLAPSYLEGVIGTKKNDLPDPQKGNVVPKPVKRSIEKTNENAVEDDADLPSFEDLQRRIREENEAQ